MYVVLFGRCLCRAISLRPGIGIGCKLHLAAVAGILIDQCLLVRQPDVGPDVDLAAIAVQCLPDDRNRAGLDCLDLFAELFLEQNFHDIGRPLRGGVSGVGDGDGSGGCQRRKQCDEGC
ncbi:hypothetical protein D3C78_1529770 [compost metagenome]